MAVVASRLSRKDLEFMAEDIGPELAPFLKPEDLASALNAEKRQRLLSLLEPEELLRAADVQKQPKLRSQLLAGMNVEELVNDISPTQQKRLFELLLKMLAAGLTDDSEDGSA